MAINNKDSYRDNPLLKKAGVEHAYTQEEVDEYIMCAKDPVYFAMKYIKIVNVDEGLMPFRMWDFQKEMIRTYHENRFSITKCPRQVGKTTTSVAYLLWLTLFSDQQNVAVLANKGSLARDILAKYQLAYENLPMWLQQGVVTWNKGNVELENGSKIIAASTSSSAVRGGAFNIVFLDEFAFVPANIANEFFNSVYPVISSGKTTKIIIVSTPNGMNLFYKLWMDAIGKKNGYKTFEIHWSMVPGRDEKWKEETIKNTSEEQFRQEFETEFLGSSNTLISGKTLQELVYQTPLSEHDMLKIYEYPIKGDDETTKDHLYAIWVDVSEGRNLDCSARQEAIAAWLPPNKTSGTSTPLKTRGRVYWGYSTTPGSLWVSSVRLSGSPKTPGTKRITLSINTIAVTSPPLHMKSPIEISRGLSPSLILSSKPSYLPHNSKILLYPESSSTSF